MSVATESSSNWLERMLAALVRLIRDGRPRPPGLELSPPYPRLPGRPAERNDRRTRDRLARARRAWEAESSSRALRIGDELVEEGLRGIRKALCEARRPPPRLPVDLPRVEGRDPALETSPAPVAPFRCTGPECWQEMLGPEGVEPGRGGGERNLLVGVTGAEDARLLEGLDPARRDAAWLLESPLPDDRLALLARANRVWVADPAQVGRLRSALDVPVDHLPPAVAPRLDNPIGWFSGRPELAVPVRHPDRPAAWAAIARMARGLALTRQEERRLARWLREDPGEPDVPAWAGRAEADDRRRYSRVRQAMLRHAIGQRLEEVYRAGDPEIAPPRRERVTVMFSSMRPQRHGALLSTLARQTCENLQVVGVLHGDRFDDACRRRFEEQAVASGLDAQVMRMSGRFLLGECLQAALDRSEGRAIVRVDDDWYGRHYVGDMAMHLRYSEAGVVHKRTRVVDRRDAGVSVLRFPGAEFLYGLQIAAGGRMAVHRDFLAEVTFRRTGVGEDVAFTHDVIEAGRPPLSVDRFNHATVRQDERLHTWKISAWRHLSARYASPLPDSARVEDFEV